MRDELGTVYLLHADTPYVGVQAHEGAKIQVAGHYLGWARFLSARLEHHLAGTGANLTRVWVQHNIAFHVVRTWPGTRSDERRLHNYGHNARLCPVCNPGALDHMRSL